MSDNSHCSSEQASPPFYIVSLNKFLLLFLGTAGLYMTYWFYKQWSCYKKAHKGTQLPVFRAIFSVFFVHSLFKILTSLYQQKSGKKSTALTTSATLFVIVTVISFLSGHVPEEAAIQPYLVLVNLISTPIFCWFCYQAQWFVNYVCDDLEGECNKELSIANYGWLGIGTLMWGMYFVYVLFPLFT